VVARQVTNSHYRLARRRAYPNGRKRPVLWAVHRSGAKRSTAARSATWLLFFGIWNLARTFWRRLGKIVRTVYQPLSIRFSWVPALMRAP
jgi:hypothetical protein